MTPRDPYPPLKASAYLAADTPWAGSGKSVTGRSERANRHKPRMDYCVFWVDSEERE